MADWKSSQEFLKEFYASPIVNEDTISAKIKRIFLPKSRKASALKELAGDFCRGCGYCMPCPKGIQINQCARMSLMLRRAPAASWLNDHWQAEMKKIEECLNCGKCKQHCPYHLNTLELLKKNYEDYKTFLK